MGSKLLAMICLLGLFSCEHPQSKPDNEKNHIEELFNLKIKASELDHGVYDFLDWVAWDTGDFANRNFKYTNSNDVHSKKIETKHQLGTIRKNSDLYLLIVPKLLYGVDIFHTSHSFKKCFFESNIPFEFQDQLKLEDQLKNIFLEIGTKKYDLHNFINLPMVEYSWLVSDNRNNLQIIVRNISSIQTIDHEGIVFLSLYPELRIGNFGVKINRWMYDLTMQGCLEKALDIVKESKTGFLPINRPFIEEVKTLMSASLGRKAEDWISQENENKQYEKNYSLALHLIITTPKKR